MGKDFANQPGRNQMTPAVSILIPCYNAECWIAQAIESALAQTWPEKEVIVVDDGSTDGSLEVIKRFDGRIRWESGPNRGGNVARNRLLELSTGEWVQYLDADDYLLPDKIEKQMDILFRNPKTDILFGPILLERCTETGSQRELLPIPEPHDEWILLARWYLPQTGSPLWRRQAILDVNGWKPEQPCCQEHELYLRLLMAGKRFSFCPNAGAVYREWGEHTVCKRDKPEVYRRRLEIERQAEKFLLDCGELTPARRWAINQARFEMARLVWQYDQQTAAEIIESALNSDPGFIPGGNAAPSFYRLLFRLFGFHLTESIAAWRRQLFRSAPRNQVATDF